MNPQCDNTNYHFISGMEDFCYLSYINVWHKICVSKLKVMTKSVCIEDHYWGYKVQCLISNNKLVSFQGVVASFLSSAGNCEKHDGETALFTTSILFLWNFQEKQVWQMKASSLKSDCAFTSFNGTTREKIKWSLYVQTDRYCPHFRYRILVPSMG